MHVYTMNEICFELALQLWFWLRMSLSSPSCGNMASRSRRWRRLGLYRCSPLVCSHRSTPYWVSQPNLISQKTVSMQSTRKGRQCITSFLILPPYMLVKSDNLSSIWNGKWELWWMHTCTVIFIWNSNCLKGQPWIIYCRTSACIKPINLSNVIENKQDMLIAFKISCSVQGKTQLIISLK